MGAGDEVGKRSEIGWSVLLIVGSLYSAHDSSWRAFCTVALKFDSKVVSVKGLYFYATKAVSWPLRSVREAE